MISKRSIPLFFSVFLIWKKKTNCVQLDLFDKIKRSIFFFKTESKNGQRTLEVRKHSIITPLRKIQLLELYAIAMVLLSNI